MTYELLGDPIRHTPAEAPDKVPSSVDEMFSNQGSEK